MTTETELVTDGLTYWADSWPRRATKYQQWATSPEEAAELVLDAEDDPQNWPFISVYSFPEGHTKDGNVPRIDRLFIDLDVPDNGNYRGSDRGDPTARWVKDMSKLLVRARKVSRFLLKTASPESWQVVLSGHKGIHLDLVFPPISTSNGDQSQFLNGINGYAASLKEYIIEATGLEDLEDYIDVDSSDLGRLRRVPNTKHLGASQAFGEDRFCVPVTLEELAEMRPADYIELTRERREVDDRFRPVPNDKAAEVLTQRIRNAPSSSRSFGGGGSTNDPARLVAYVEAQNDKITVDSLDFVMTDRPCIAEFFKREDAFGYRSASHYMEMFAITHMMDKKVPIELDVTRDDAGNVTKATVIGGTMVEAFRGLPGFDEDYTCERVETYISLGYSPMKCETVWKKAPTFCLQDSCGIWVGENPRRKSA
ncbi:hypothetical protein JMJ58_19520 [Haloterrigena salifodinae]|uniref:Uncharacterized protein n=1 Tax=Haloterrigena salifodinae TaxID=2675099 RepID=A0A8T8E100_9EURY|nr:hypothetical protein [Haloterrigena salifodinae]QRV15071.1 hypothetical protein JMJ58_19520 [Haloterrigena salifodinae]